ncbi:MAG TPA: DoxX family protein [Rhizomicrobium sp.]|jgi:putative oxidoreductase|nr:DoxX family protein [Rhizomicrobium sp.]
MADKSGGGSDGFLARWTPQLLGLLRIMSGLLFFEHGTGKLFHFPHIALYDSVRLASLVGVAGMMELVGGAMLALGLFARPVAFLLSGEMAVAYFLYHNRVSFFPLVNEGDSAILYCFVFLYIAAAGGGAWSLDRLRATPEAAK